MDEIPRTHTVWKTNEKDFRNNQVANELGRVLHIIFLLMLLNFYNWYPG